MKAARKKHAGVAVRRLRKRALFSSAVALLLAAHAPAVLAGDSAQELRDMSIEDLGNIAISSVSKKAEPLSEAPAAIYVITPDEIHRSGADSVPDMLRLAPNLEVGSIGSNLYAISARGFNSNLANKLLVLIDGRSVFTPLFGGVYWDMQNVLPDDIARIEVISGPGATLWGANAVNGVINITTRSSADTQGGLVTFGGGDQALSASARYGGRVNDDLTYRLYGEGFGRNAVQKTAGGSAGDGWSMAQGGFRVDWTPANDTVTLQGDLYRGSEDQPAAINQSVDGQNVLARWQHNFGDGSQLQVQAYYDSTRRMDAGGFEQDAYDLDVQDSFALGSWNSIVWGGGYRVTESHIANVDAFQIQPARENLRLGNVFLQDAIAITEKLKLTLGMKLEDDPYSGLAPLPSARLAWKVTDNVLLWSAVSRAVRAPTRFDRDVIEKLGTLVFLTGGANFTSEKLIAYEVGTRIEPTSSLSFSVSGFYNDYDDLRSTEATPTTIFPLYWGNLMAGKVYGVETWANYQVVPWWMLSAGFNIQHEDLHFKAGSSALGGLEQAGNDPDRQFSLRSSMDVADNLTFESDLRYVSSLPNPATPAYVELNSRLNWRVSDLLEFSISGLNLLHASHREFTTSGQNNRIERSVFAETRWRF